MKTVNTKAEYGTELREETLATFLTFVRLQSGARFFANVAFPIFSDDEDDAFRFASDEDVEDENDERRFWVDIFNGTQFKARVQEAQEQESKLNTQELLSQRSERGVKRGWFIDGRILNWRGVLAVGSTR